jgi:hypothetical protein
MFVHVSTCTWQCNAQWKSRQVWLRPVKPDRVSEFKDQLHDAIEAFLRRHNERAKPFCWRKREVKGSPLRNPGF